MINGGRAALLVQGGPNSGQTIVLSGRPITMGRRSDNDVIVEDDTVSRRHALIMETPNGFVLLDLNSTNGTFVNRTKLRESERPLKHGDKITLAGSVMSLVFRQEGAETAKMALESPGTGVMNVQDLAPSASPDGQRPGPQVSGKEGLLLKHMDARRGTVVSREEIRRNIWPELPLGTAANQEIERAVEALRAEMEDEPSAPIHLITVGEFGYLLV